MKRTYSKSPTILSIFFVSIVMLLHAVGNILAQTPTDSFNFDSDAVGDVPAGWSVIGTPAGDNRVRADMSVSAPNSLHAVDESNAYMTWLGRELLAPVEAADLPVTLEFQCINTGAGAATFAISKGDYLGGGNVANAIFLFDIIGGKMHYYGPGYTELTSYSNNEWHKIKIAVNSFTSAAVYIDDVLKGTVTPYNGGTQITHVHLGASGTPSNIADAYYDDVKIYYTLPAPDISTVSPNSGSTTGGTSVTISGSNFGGSQGTGSVTFGGVEATSYTSWSSTEIVCVTPAHTAGAVDVVVTADNGQSGTKADGFTYEISLQLVLGNQTIGLGDSATADLIYQGDNFKGCELQITFSTSVDFDGISGETNFPAYPTSETTTSVTLSVAYMEVGSTDRPGKIATLTFQGVQAGEGNIAFAASEVRGLSDDGDSQVTIAHDREVTGYINVDGIAPTVDAVTITNDTVAATDDYVKDIDQVTVSASGTDLPAESWAAGMEASGVTADLSGFGGGGAVPCDPANFSYAPGTRQWTASWTLSVTDTTPDDGTITVTVKATDKEGNYDANNDGADTIIADNTAPTITNIVCVKTVDANGMDMADLDNTYAKDGDTLSLTAEVTDPAAGAENVKSGVPEASSITADLNNINGNNADDADSYSDPNASWPITVTGAVEGAHLIQVTATDLVGNSDMGTAASAINIDNTAPGHVSSFKATADGSVELEFSFSGVWDTDYIGIRFSRTNASAMISGSLGYPRYDHSGNYPEPNGYQVGRSCNDDAYYADSPTDVDATHIDQTYTSDPGAPVTYEDATAGQDVYYYQSYAYDKAGNFSAADTTNHNDRDSASGYFLGDFDNDSDVDFDDLTPFSNAFGLSFALGDGNTNDVCDIGPTGATQTRPPDNRFGLPSTDGFVDFEDLMIFAMNYNNVPPAPMYQPPVFPENTPLVSLSSEQKSVDAGAIFSVALKLSHQLKAKGAHLRLSYDARYFEVVEVTQGNLGLTFFSAPDKGGVVDINVAALGGDVPLAGETIATVEFRAKGSAPFVSLYLSRIDVRGVRNERADDKLSKLGVVGLNLSVGKPDVTGVFHNYPNPFNPETWIPFQLEKEADVRLKIYDLQGHLVKTIELGNKPAGYYLSKERALHWDGRNDSGEKVSSGIYLYQFQAGKVVKTSKMVILK